MSDGQDGFHSTRTPEPDNFLEYVDYSPGQTGSDAFARYYYLLTDLAASDPETGPSGIDGFTVDKADPYVLVASDRADPPGSDVPAGTAYEARWLAPGDILSGFGNSKVVRGVVLDVSGNRLNVDQQPTARAWRGTISCSS